MPAAQLQHARVRPAVDNMAFSPVWAVVVKLDISFRLQPVDHRVVGFAWFERAPRMLNTGGP